MGLRLFVVFLFFSATNVANADGVVNVFDMPAAAAPEAVAEAYPAPAPAPVAVDVSAPVVQVFSQMDSAPVESQQFTTTGVVTPESNPSASQGQQAVTVY